MTGGPKGQGMTYALGSILRFPQAQVTRARARRDIPTGRASGARAMAYHTGRAGRDRGGLHGVIKHRGNGAVRIHQAGS